jgi:hypothetical protein
MQQAVSFLVAIVLAASVSCRTVAAEFNLDTGKIEEAAGAKGVLNKDEGVFKVSYPRSDVKVAVDGTVLPPFMGLTSWVSFMPGTTSPAMAMGDFVLFEDEVNSAMNIALNGGLTVTALHNHFFFDEPKVYFMHIGGEGDPIALAGAVKKMQDRVHEIRGRAPKPTRTFGLTALPGKSTVTAGPIEESLGKGTANSGMYKVVIGRTTKMACGCTVGKEMGVNTWAAFYGTDDHALVDGDFVVLETELQGVLRSLRASGINIVAIHSHMDTDNPKMLFLHYWGVGPTAELAKAVKGALDTLKK